MSACEVSFSLRQKNVSSNMWFQWSLITYVWLCLWSHINFGDFKHVQLQLCSVSWANYKLGTFPNVLSKLYLTLMYQLLCFWWWCQHVSGSLGCCSLQSFGSEHFIIGPIAIQFSVAIHGSLRMNPNASGNPLTFTLVSGRECVTY